MNNELGDVRRSQVITTHGPGAIIDFRAGSHGGAPVSVVAAGLDEWELSAGSEEGLQSSQAIMEPRLQKELGVQGFRMPPVSPQIAPGVYSKRSGRLVGVRFPRWLQCPHCHRLRKVGRWTIDPGDPAPYCVKCSNELGGRNRVHVVPVRFIVMCEYGHLDEFPWEWWAAHKDSCRQRGDLKLEGSATAGLSGLILSCTECEETRTMQGIFSDTAIPWKCSGKRPWLGEDAIEECRSERPRVVQRGASNTYFSVIESTLDIPPWSDPLQKALTDVWHFLAADNSSEKRRLLIQATGVHERLNMDVDELLKEVNDRLSQLSAPGRNLRWEEYQRFTNPQTPFAHGSEFEVHSVETPPELSSWLSRIIKVSRLREVRALRGFTRILPPSPGDTERIANISRENKNWLPAVENRGEGIFVELSEERVAEWETRNAVNARVSELRTNYSEAWKERGRSGIPPDQITPRHLLVHSISHALIRQLALSSGYNSASLRERLYVSAEEPRMTGFLIFTSSSDADGTLGGLARQAATESILSLFEQALISMSWCSSDPLCVEGVQSLSTAANGAACHSCLLAAETSCEEFNSFLDRALMVGLPDDGSAGFFRDYIDELLGDS